KFYAYKNGYKIVGDYEVYISEGHTFTIPDGYFTDGASIPRWFWPVFGHPMTGGYLIAAVVHDILCDEAKAKRDYALRVYADGIFFLLLSRHGVPFWKRYFMLWGVRFHAF